LRHGQHALSLTPRLQPGARAGFGLANCFNSLFPGREAVKTAPGRRASIHRAKAAVLMGERPRGMKDPGQARQRGALGNQAARTRAGLAKRRGQQQRVLQQTPQPLLPHVLPPGLQGQQVGHIGDGVIQQVAGEGAPQPVRFYKNRSAHGVSGRFRS